MTTGVSAPKDGLCIVPDCLEPHHARQLCDEHYQVWRRTGEAPLPSIKEARSRERLIREELSLGFLGEEQGTYEGNTMFASEAERRAAWDRYGPELTADYEAYERGFRPSAWWRYVAGRPEHLTKCPSMRDGHDLTAQVRWSHESEVEMFTFMAANGHLTDAERARIAERGNEARARIAGRERKAALGRGSAAIGC